MTHSTNAQIPVIASKISAKPAPANISGIPEVNGVVSSSIVKATLKKSLKKCLKR